MADSTLSDISATSLTAETIRRMYQLVDQAKTDEKFQKLIYGIVNRAMPGVWKQYKNELTAVFNWFKANHDYRRDPYAVELLHDVWATMDRRRFDCDDSSIYMAAAAEVLGSPTEFVTVSTRPDHEPSHVWSEARVNGIWYGMDATVPSSFIGWEPMSGITDKKIWSRQEVGLSGIEDSMIDGLGQSVDLVITPGPSSADVADNSNFASQPRPGGGVYNPELPVLPTPTPAELFTTIPQAQVPMILDPREDFWGGTKTLRETHSVMMPGDWVDPNNYLKDLSGLGEIVQVGGRVVDMAKLGELADVIHDDLCQQVVDGELHPNQIPNMLGAIFNPNHPWRKGTHGPARQSFWQRNNRLAGKIRKTFDANKLNLQRLSSHSPTVEATTMLGQAPQIDPALYQAVVNETARQLPPALASAGIHPSKLKFKKHMGHHLHAMHRGMGGLGQTDPNTQAAQNNAIANVASGVTGAIAGAVAPSDAASITAAVTSGINSLLGVVAPVAAPAIPWSTILPVAAIGAVALVGWKMSKKSKKSVYQRNPRRGGRRRSSGGGKSFFSSENQKTLLMVGAAGLGYWFYTKSSAAAPTAAKPATTSLLSQGSSIFSAIGKLFGGSSTPATPAAAPAPSAGSPSASSIPGLYTENTINPPAAPAAAPDPTMVTSLDMSS